MFYVCYNIYISLAISRTISTIVLAPVIMLYDRLWIIGDTCSDNNMSAGQYYIYKYNNVRWHTSSAVYIYIS